MCIDFLKFYDKICLSSLSFLLSKDAIHTYFECSILESIFEGVGVTCIERFGPHSAVFSAHCTRFLVHKIGKHFITIAQIDKTFSFLNFGLHPVIVRAYSVLCAQDSLLVVRGGPGARGQTKINFSQGKK